MLGFMVRIRVKLIARPTPVKTTPLLKFPLLCEMREPTVSGERSPLKTNNTVTSISAPIMSTLATLQHHKLLQ